MKKLFLLLLFPHLLFANVVYEKLGFTDAKGREVVSLAIEGRISTFDYDDFEAAINDINQNHYRVQFDSVMLNSRGGLIGDAMRIGKLLRANHLSTWILPHSVCASACVLILQGGVCKMADGDVGVHRARYEDDIPLDTIYANVKEAQKDMDQYLTLMGSSSQLRWLMKSIPNWDMKFLVNFEKRDFGFYSATEEEMQYRLEIASKKMGQYKENLLEKLGDIRGELYPDATWEVPDYVYAYPSCSEQLFLEDNMTDHVGINIEPDPQDIFEIYQWERGIENDEGTYVATDKVPHKDEQFYYYSFKYFAKGKEVTYQERVTLAAPTTWTSEEEGIDYAENTTPGYEVSDDKSTITVTKTIPNDGFVFGGWIHTKEDPKGPFTIEILFKDKVVQTFNYVVE